MLELVTIVYSSVAIAVAKRFTARQIAGDGDGLAAFLASAMCWGVWPSLAVIAPLLAFGRPKRWLFEPKFIDAYSAMFFRAICVHAHAAVGSAVRPLVMVDRAHACALGYAAVFAIIPTAASCWLASSAA